MGECVFALAVCPVCAVTFFCVCGWVVAPKNLLSLGCHEHDLLHGFTLRLLVSARLLCPVKKQPPGGMSHGGGGGLGGGGGREGCVSKMGLSCSVIIPNFNFLSLRFLRVSSLRWRSPVVGVLGAVLIAARVVSRPLLPPPLPHSSRPPPASLQFCGHVVRRAAVSSRGPRPHDECSCNQSAQPLGRLLREWGRAAQWLTGGNERGHRRRWYSVPAG